MKKHIGVLLVSLACLWSPGGPAWAGPPPGGVIKAEGARQDVDATPTIQEAGTLTLNYKGQHLTLQGRTTSILEEFLVDVQAPELSRLASAFGARLEWQAATATLVCHRPSDTRTLKQGQPRVQSNPERQGPERADLAFPIQPVEGKMMMSLSALEELLDVRLTFREGGVVWMEPLIRSVRLDGPGTKPRLIVEATAPVTYKTFTLRQPDRYVIDVYGAVLDTPSLTVAHPGLGTVRLGQFELGPARSRIVIPTQAGVDVRGPKAGRAEALSFQLSLPNLATPGQNFQAEKVTSVSLEPTKAGQRILINSTGPVQYQWQRLAAPDNRFLVDIPQAILVGPKQEIEGDGELLSSVRVSQFQPAPNPVVRLVLDMTRPLEARLVQGDQPGMLAIEVSNKAPDSTLASSSSSSKGNGASAFPASGGVICIDPGHGGSDVGAQNKDVSLNEANVTLDIAKRLASLLKAQGWNVIMTRTTDKDVSYWGSSAKEELAARVKIANDMKADLFLSIHCNASASAKGNGTSIHYYKQSDYLLASELQPGLLSSTGRANRGLQANRFYVLAHSEMPAVLVETAFITNPQEGSLLADPDYRQRIAEGLAQGLRQYASRNLNWAAAGR